MRILYTNMRYLFGPTDKYNNLHIIYSISNIYYFDHDFFQPLLQLKVKCSPQVGCTPSEEEGGLGS